MNAPIDPARRALAMKAPDAIAALARSQAAAVDELDLAARIRAKTGLELEAWYDALTLDDKEQFQRRVGGLVAVLDELDPAPVDASGWPAPMTAERRTAILRTLGLPELLARLVDTRNPLPDGASGSPLVWVDPNRVPEHMAGYTELTRGSRWRRYRSHLQDQMRWPIADLQSLGSDLDLLVQAFPDPSTEGRSPRRMLVVGYTQSGKTANFLGLTARLADAGVRFVIILSGRTKILRRQTQARVDRDLIGRDPANLGLLTQEYESSSRLLAKLAPVSPDWDASDSWTRLSQSRYDRSIGIPGKVAQSDDDAYQRPMGGLASKDARRPMVVVLKKTVGDLEAFKAALTASPIALRRAWAVVIDEEADDASLNYKAPKAGAGGWAKISSPKDRSRINSLIADILDILDRGIYIGYTATPFANCFADPDDGRGFFPHAIQVLQTPDGYFGANRVFDKLYDGPPTDLLPSEAHLREIASPMEENSELPLAIDDYLLAGAIKMFRMARAAEVGDERALQRLRHHTMMVHLDTGREHQREWRDVVRDLMFNRAGRGLATMSPAESASRLRDRYEREFQVQSSALIKEPGRLPTRDMDTSWVPSWDGLEPHVRRAAEILLEANRRNAVVLLVNSDDDRETPEYDADASDIGRWCVVIGGHMLSRGFTVEGLSTVYFRRKASAMDTLLQLARWNGYRSYYEDVIRLYVGTAEPGRKSGPPRNLWQELEDSSVRDATFREVLRRYGEEGTSPHLELPEFADERGGMRYTASQKMRGAIRQARGPIEYGRHGLGLVDFTPALARLEDHWRFGEGFVTTPICANCQTGDRLEAAQRTVSGDQIAALVADLVGSGSDEPGDLDAKDLKAGLTVKWHVALLGSRVGIEHAPVEFGGLSVPVRRRSTLQQDTLSSGPWNRWLRILAGGACDVCRTVPLAASPNPAAILLPYWGGPESDGLTKWGLIIELPGRSGTSRRLISGRSGRS